MSRGDRRSKNLIVAAIFILLEVAAIAILKSSSAIENVWFNRFSHRVMAAVWGGAKKVGDFVALADVNSALIEENAALTEQILRMREREVPVLDSNLESRYSFILGRISKMSVNTAHNYIIIDKGSEDGVSPNSGIISAQGVVGMVTAVSRHFSYGLTLMNPRFNISARLGRNGVVSPVFWDGKNTDGAEMSDLPIKYSIAPQDTVWTSGFSTLFPPDIPIGVVVDQKTVNGATKQASIRLFQDFKELNYVLIVNNSGSQEMRELENRQKEGKR